MKRPGIYKTKKTRLFKPQNKPKQKDIPQINMQGSLQRPHVQDFGGK